MPEVPPHRPRALQGRAHVQALRVGGEIFQSKDDFRKIILAYHPYPAYLIAVHFFPSLMPKIHKKISVSMLPEVQKAGRIGSFTTRCLGLSAYLSHLIYQAAPSGQKRKMVQGGYVPHEIK